jgi:hypothetical protein
MKISWLRNIALAALLMVLLSACAAKGGDLAEIPATSDETPLAADAVEAATEIPLSTDTPEMEEVAATAEPSATDDVDEAEALAEEDANLEAQTVAPTPRADLYATDPASVTLASGKVQLVELFAYW